MLKDAITATLERMGFALVRTDPKRIKPPTLHTPDELRQLDRDLAAMYARDSFVYYPTAKSLRGYLSDKRINLYHEVLAACADGGVDLAGKSVMEVGVGTGYLLRLIGQRFPTASLHGIDFYEELTRFARTLAPGAQITQAGIEDLQGTAATYDVIFCMEVIEHILDTETPIPNLLSHLEPGGVLMVSVPDAVHDRTPAMTTDNGNTYVGHVNFWSEESWAYYIQRIVPDAKVVTGRLHSLPALYAIIHKP